jgi:hypothetical protein
MNANLVYGIIIVAACLCFPPLLGLFLGMGVFLLIRAFFMGLLGN